MRVSFSDHEEMKKSSPDKKVASDKTADASFQQGPARQKSKLIKNNEQAIKEHDLTRGLKQKIPEPKTPFEERSPFENNENVSENISEN